MSETALVALKTVGLLIVSNTFMTIAWYGHLKHRNSPLLFAILASWSIALLEYMFQVPANRIGSSRFTLTQLKVTQECVTLAVFVIYARIAYGQQLKWNSVVAGALIVLAVLFAFMGGAGTQTTAPGAESGRTTSRG